ncbi:site-specific integrase [candidate division KSB1 bacterium]|nr:site-specific integrase [candidate division KSB1 bacterium]NIR72289.1 site-specific integrase [candidate division KSB1 bacterium]NIS24260.1 site-specific integrase [candidate division KSB1 bacterium]NIT71175.1 site-specific integrase [candidate division KSB1 bacterium]NIU24879.1 site-specific integrase [candidate division KSB1 bacterium]
MGIYKQPRSPYYYYSFTIDGRRIRGSTHTTNKTLARQIYETKKADYLRNQNFIKKSSGMSLRSLADEVLEWSRVNRDSYERDVIYVDHLLKFFGNSSISDITSFDVEKYKMYRVKHVSPATVNKEVSFLGRMYNLAIQWDKATYNPVKGLKKFTEPKRSFRWWTQEEIKKFLDACNPQMKAITLVGINTGMRIGEILGLRWEHVDLDNRYITVVESKAGEYRKIYMNATVTRTLKGIEPNGEYVFCHSNGKRIKRVIKGFKATAKRAGIAPSTPHVMRHTFASHLTMQGVDPHTIMELGGWKSLDMVMRYSHLAPDHKQRAVEKLDEMAEYCLTGQKSGDSK